MHKPGNYNEVKGYCCSKVEQNTVNVCIDVRFILRALNVYHLNYIKNKILIFNYINFKF